MNNQCTFVGRVGADPTTKIFADTNNKVVKFSLAVKDFSPNRDEVRTTWISVDAWNGLGDRVLQTVAKGREIVINGRLSTTTYKTEKDGVMHCMMIDAWDDHFGMPELIAKVREERRSWAAIPELPA